jgi:hypothetical protein
MVLSGYQRVAVGDRVPMSAAVSDATAFTVTALETNRWLVWRRPDCTWVWTLTPVEGGTRLVTWLRAERLAGGGAQARGLATDAIWRRPDEGQESRARQRPRPCDAVLGIR